MLATNQNSTFRGACLTIFSDVPTELPVKLQYFAYSMETCPTTNKRHAQAWAYSTKAMRFTGWKKIFPDAHIEQMRGTFAENDVYISKESQLTSYGERPMENGKKRTLQDLVDEVSTAARDGIRLSEVIDATEHKSTYVQYHGGIQKLHSMIVSEKLRRVDKDIAPEVYWIQGPPGSGKTRYVHDKEATLYDCPVDDSYKWKDGYSGEDAVLYDNMSLENFKCPARLLKEIDRYFIQVPIKGGFIGWRPKRIYITSVHTLEFFATTGGFTDPNELFRRVTTQMTL